MLVSPGSAVRVANSEKVTLALDVDVSLASVRLVPRIGEERVLALEENAFAFPVMSSPDSVTVGWFDAEGNHLFESRVDVVSRHYFRLSQLKEYGGGMDDFEDLPDDVLYRARQAATEVFEVNARRSFVHRVGHTVDYGTDALVHLRHNDVYKLLTDGFRLVSDCQVRHELLAPKDPPERIEYLYGIDEMPEEVSRAVLELAAYGLRPTNRPIGATGESTDAGYIHFTTAGRDGATDIPEVNAAIEQFGRGRRLLW